MLEILYLFFIIPRRMTKLARERGLNPLKWALAGSGTWFVVEAFLAIFIIVCVRSVRWAFDWQGDLGFITIVLYIGPLIAGMMAFGRVERTLEEFPVLESSDHEEDGEPVT